METNEELVQVFTGSLVESNYIKELLNEGGIGAMVRNTLSESMVAGWASGSPEDAALVFVAESHAASARLIIDEYLSSQG